MRPARFAFHAPADLTEALGLLEHLGPDAVPLAGGQTLIPLLNMRLARPAHVVDLNRLTDLGFIQPDQRAIRLGAMTRQFVLEQSAAVREACPLLAHVVPFVGHAQTRSRGTLGGSLAFASSVGELGVALLAVGATLRIADPSGVRSISIDDFFLDYFTTALRPGELLTEVVVPRTGERRRWGFSELKLRSCDFPIVVAATVLDLDDFGRCTSARITLGGAAPTPIRVTALETVLQGQLLSRSMIQEVAEASRDLVVDDIDEVRATARYRRAMVPVQLRQALQMAIHGSTDD